MSGLRILSAGESHGRALTAIIEGIPAGLVLPASCMDSELFRRQQGYGRGGRMKIESDRAQILSGVRWGRTLGSPVAVMVENKDWQNWQQGMSPQEEHAYTIPPVTRPRPGHADLAGVAKYGFLDIRNVLERSSARETAVRVALAAICKKLLLDFGITLGSYVVRIGEVAWHDGQGYSSAAPGPVEWAQERVLLNLHAQAELSPVRCPDPVATELMMNRIDEAKAKGDSLGGIFEVFATGLPPGLGSHVHWDRRIDGRLAQALMSIQAVKAVEMGLGLAMAFQSGSQVMDEIFPGSQQGAWGGFYRKTNNAGGVEGGMTNGMPLVARAAMKPIPTLRTPLASVDLATGEAVSAAYERSDVCAVPACSVIAEAMAALILADELVAKFGGDSMEEMQRNYEGYKKTVFQKEAQEGA